MFMFFVVIGLAECTCGNPAFPDPTTLEGQGFYVNGNEITLSGKEWTFNNVYFSICGQDVMVI